MPTPSDERLGLVVDVRNACAEADGHDPLDEAAWLRLKNHGLDDVPARVERDGFALLRGTELDLAVRPSARRGGLGTALAASVAPSEGPLTAWAHGDHPAAARLAERHGLARTRELWVMRRPTSLAVPEVPAPDGVRVRPFRPDRPEDAEALLAVNAAAFAHHPEQGALDHAQLAERMAEPWFDPAGLLMAVDADDRLLAFHWTKQHDARTGEVYVVGVDPRRHGGGLGKLVTAAGLRHLAGLGVEEVLLYVEAEHDAAVRLYGGLGFTHAASDTHVQYARG